MLLKNKTAILTGCNRGIGKSILEIFAENGCNIFACSRTESDEFSSSISNLVEKYHVEITPIYFDLKHTDQIKESTKSNMFEVYLQKVHMIPLRIEPPHIRASFLKMIHDKVMKRKYNII